MLDGALCLFAGQEGCDNAKSIKHAITTNGKHVELSNYKIWYFPSNGNVLNFKNNEEGLSLSSVVSDIFAQAGNGLYYTKTSGVFGVGKSLNGEFGVANWASATCNYVNDNMNSTNICAIRGMRLPRYDETSATNTNSNNPCSSAGSSLGVPQHPSGRTWTATSHKSDTKYYYRWTSTGDNNAYDNTYYIRCVR